MSRYRDFEVLYENIVHISKCITMNEAISVLMVESFSFSQEEKLNVAVVVCKLEYIRAKNRYTEELGLNMYQWICDIFTENTQYENFLQLSTHLDNYMVEQKIKMSITDFNRIVPVVGKYFQFTPNEKKELLQKMHPKPKQSAHLKQTTTSHPHGQILAQSPPKKKFRFPFR